MSKIWKNGASQAATVVDGWGAFGSVGNDNRSFRTLYGEGESNRAWNMTFPGQTTQHQSDMLEPVPPVDPIEEAAQEAFVQGFTEGERITREAAELNNVAREQLTLAVQTLAQAGEGALATLISQAVIRLVGQIIGEVPIDKDVLKARCEAVAGCIDGNDSPAKLEVNPEDLPLLQAEALGVMLVGNPALSRGSVRLATADGWIEDGPDIRLDRLKALMDDMEGKL